MIYVIFLIAIIAGIFGSILGLGGGVIIVPALTLIFGVPIRYAVGASIVSVIATSSGAAATYIRDRITNVRIAMLLEVATSVGALGGAMLSTYVSPGFLFGLFAIVLTYSALMMFRKKKSGDSLAQQDSDALALRLNLPSSYHDPVINKEVVYGVKNVKEGFGLMFGAGVLSGLLGIGSGSLKVPAMDTAMHLPIKVSSATSNFMMGVTAAASAGAYYVRGDIQPRLAAPVALGVFLGALVGTKLMMRMKSEKIRKIFVVVLIIIALQMVFKAVGVEIR